MLPSREDAQKLVFEFWKAILLGALGLLALAFPVVRSWISARIQDGWSFAWSEVRLQGWVVIIGLLSCLYAVLSVVVWIPAMRRPTFVRRYKEGDYNAIHWKWRWKNRKVDISSMVAQCPTCRTELIINSGLDPRNREDPTIYTNIFCTTCNIPSRISNVSNLKDHIRRKIESDCETGRWELTKSGAA